MIYPSHFNEMQKKEFEDAVKIMQDLNAVSLIVHDGESFILMELPDENPSQEAWDAFRQFNATHDLFLELVSVSDDLEGVRYYGN